MAKAKQQLSKELGAARYAALTSRAVTDTANALIDELMEIIPRYETRWGARHYSRGSKKQDDFRRALQGVIGDLLRAQGSEQAKGWVFRSMRPAGFTGEDVGFRTFQRLIDALSELGFIERRAGFQGWTTGFDAGDPPVPSNWRYASRFRATAKLIDLSARMGVPITDVGAHFIVGLPKKPLQLRATSTRNEYGAKVRGIPMKFERTAKTELLENQIRELNEFFDTFDLRGGIHRGFIRVFNKGDHPKFDWNKGGRLYSQGHDQYQQMEKSDRLRMTIGGQPVSEIDIRASYLTIFHAYYGAPFDPSSDPYDLQELKDPPALVGRAGIKRAIVKSWFVATFGNDGHLERWPKETIKEYRDAGYELGKLYPVKRIREAAIAKYLMLDLWGAKSHDFGWADLMFLESDAMIRTMLQLMSEHQVPSLSVHDSLLVPSSKSALAEATLREQYRRAVGVHPHLVVHKTAEPSKEPAAIESIRSH